MAERVVIALHGGLGNQLFQLCAGETIREQGRVHVDYDVEMLFRGDVFGRRCEVQPWIPPGHTASLARSIGDRLIGRIHRSCCLRVELARCRREGKVALPLGQVLRAIRLWPGDTIRLRSNFQSLEYLHQGVIGRLRDSLPGRPGDAATAVHFRMLRDRTMTGAAMARLSQTLLPSAYYSQALSRLPARTPIRVFGDGGVIPEGLFPQNSMVTYDQPEPGEASWVALSRMAACRNFLLANSTFSWWAACLSGREAEVLYPSPWLFDSEMPEQRDIFPSHWTPVEWMIRPKPD